MGGKVIFKLRVLNKKQKYTNILTCVRDEL